MSRGSIGRALLTLAALFSVGATVGPDLLTPTHVFDPAWPPHARFHAALAAFTAAGNSLVALYLVWSRNDLHGCRLAAVLIALFWMIFLGCARLPGVALMAPALELAVAFVPLVLTAVGYWLARTDGSGMQSRPCNMDG